MAQIRNRPARQDSNSSSWKINFGRCPVLRFYSQVDNCS